VCTVLLLRVWRSHPNFTLTHCLCGLFHHRGVVAGAAGQVLAAPMVDHAAPLPTTGPSGMTRTNSCRPTSGSWFQVRVCVTRALRLLTSSTAV
jgi:hypothetical protein